MTTKQWLDRVRGLTEETDALIMEKEKAYDDVTRATRPMYGDKVQTSRRNISEELMINYIAYSDLLQKRLSELFLVKTKVQEAILKVEDPELRTLLMEKHIALRSWEGVAERLGKSRYHVEQRLQQRALKEVGKHLTNNAN